MNTNNEKIQREILANSFMDDLCTKIQRNKKSIEVYIGFQFTKFNCKI